MAKPIVGLLTDLQVAVEKAEADHAALQAAQAEGTKAVDAAKAQYDAVVASAKAKVDAAAKKAGESGGIVLKLQDEVNLLLGRFDSRVRVG